MAAPVSFFVLFLVTTLLHHRQLEAISVEDANRVLISYHQGFDNCKDITDSSSDASKSAADEACGQAFEALDRLDRNSCTKWQNPGCRLVSGQKNRQCTCKISFCDENSLRKDIVKPFRECAKSLWDYEERTKVAPVPLPDFQRRRSKYDEALRLAHERRSSGYSGQYSRTSSSGAAFVFTAGEVGSTSGGQTAHDAASSSHPADATPVDHLRPYQCTICLKRFGTQGYLARHMRGHAAWDTKCRDCNYDFATKQALKLHLKNQHSGSEKAPRARGPQPRSIRANKARNSGAFVCSECGKTYNCISNLRDHELSHTTLSTHCFKCKITLTSKQSYKNHLQCRHPEDLLAWEETERKLYDEENPVVCDQCNKRYKTVGGLRQHKAYHDGKTKCDECDAVFQQRSSLYTHKANAHPKKDH